MYNSLADTFGPTDRLLPSPLSHFKTFQVFLIYEGWNFNSGNYLFTTDTK